MGEVRTEQGCRSRGRRPPRWLLHQASLIPSTLVPGLALVCVFLTAPISAGPSQLQVRASRNDNPGATSITPDVCPDAVPETVPVLSSLVSSVERVKQKLKWEGEGDQGQGEGSASAESGFDCLVRDLSLNNSLCPPPPSSWDYPLWCNASGDVVYLNASDENLLGIVPPALSKLSSLQALDLSRNALSGNIPLSLSTLTTLTLVNLADSGIEGRLNRSLRALAPELQHLDLSLNAGITGSMDKVTRFTGLTYLSLADTGITGGLPTSISRLQSLKYLDLSNTGLSGPLPSELFLLTNLVSLLIDGHSTSPPPAPSADSNVTDDSSSPPAAPPDSWTPAVLPSSPPTGAVQSAAASPPSPNGFDKRLIGVIAVGASSLLVLVAAVLGVICIVQRRKDSLLSSSRFEKGPVKLSFQEIQGITGGFSTPLLSDSGGDAKVFKGTLEAVGVEVAVERTGIQTKEELEAVVNATTTVQHANVMRLLGYCSHGTEHFLVHEFVELGSLESLLKINPGSLTWTRRLNIAAGAALGLDYLHSSSETPLIHGNLTPASIFVTAAYCAKLGDVGLAKEQGQSARRSPGYVDESAVSSEEVTPKVDVYSFGVVLLELTTGLQVFEDGEHITRTVAKVAASSDDGAIDLMPSYVVWDESSSLDSAVSGSPDVGGQKAMKKVFEAMLALGFMCCQPDPSKRPNMRSVAEWLEQMAGGRVKRELRLNITRLADGIESGSESGRSSPA